MKVFIIIAFGILHFGCNPEKQEANISPFKELLTNTDSVKVSVFEIDTTITDKMRVESLTELISGENKDFKNDNERGRLRFFKNDSLILEATLFGDFLQYSINDKTFKSRYHYSGGMFLDEFGLNRQIIQK